jgi:hypothetical protein
MSDRRYATINFTIRASAADFLLEIALLTTNILEHRVSGHDVGIGTIDITGGSQIKDSVAGDRPNRTSINQLGTG